MSIKKLNLKVSLSRRWIRDKVDTTVEYALHRHISPVYLQINDRIAASVCRELSGDAINHDIAFLVDDGGINFAY